MRSVFDKLGVWSRLELVLYVASHAGEKWAEGLAGAPAAQPLTAGAAAGRSA